MIKIINGTLGGGKTALSVAYIYTLVPNKQTSRKIVKDQSFDREYKKVYTNVSDFKGDDFRIPVEFLNWDVLNKCAMVLHLLHQRNTHVQSIDLEVNNFFDQITDRVDFDEFQTNLEYLFLRAYYDDIVGFRFNRVLFVIDEFGDFFTKDQDHLIKWFNWSRHLYQDMILVQNDISRIDKAYKSDKVVKHYIQAADSENRLHPSLFKYAYFDSPNQAKSSKPAIKNVFIPKWIFSKYESGQKQTSFPAIYKYLIGFLLIIGSLIYSLYDLIAGDKSALASAAVSTESNIQHDDQRQYQLTSSFSDEKPRIKRVARSRKVACFKCTNDLCMFEDDIYSVSRLESSIDRYHFKFKYSDRVGVFTNYCYSADSSFFKQYAKPVKRSSFNRPIVSNPF